MVKHLGVGESRGRLPFFMPGTIATTTGDDMPDIINIPPTATAILARTLGTLERKAARTDEASTRQRASRGEPKAQQTVRQWDREDRRRVVPRYMPDGTDIKTVSQLATMMGTTPQVAAGYALEEKGMAKSLRMEAKRLQGAPQSDKDGIAIMLQPAIASAQAISTQVENAMRPDEFHVTLAYFGETGEDGAAVTLQDVIGWAEELASTQDPFFVSLNGLTRFNGGDRDAVVLNVDSPVVEELRKHANLIFGSHIERSHGFTPHMTIGYLDPDEDLPFQRVPHIDDAYIEYVTVAYGEQYIRIRLGRVDRENEQKDVSTGSAPALPAGMGTHKRIIVRRNRRGRRRIFGIEVVPQGTTNVDITDNGEPAR